MLQGTLQVLKGLFTHITEEKWQELAGHPTKLSVVKLALSKITVTLDFLAQKGLEVPFTHMTACLETVHADLSSLLEVLTPFVSDDFCSIYRDLLYSDLSMPEDLKLLTSCGIHTSGMTSLAAILKAAEKTLGKRPSVLYGENTYFECVNSLRKVSRASCMNTATEEDWKKADLLVAQFNPVLRLGSNVEYKVEKIERCLRECLDCRGGIPLTLALDCTIDFLHSPQMAKLLQEFQHEIKNGALNVIGFRSGNKFDLFGMDNYCGAPFFMIHNQDPKWNFFHSLSTDLCLQADRLSVNWFCLAYQSAASQLDLYRKQIFDNTRALLNKVPERLKTNQTIYRVSPAEEAANLAFIDVKILGPFHMCRGSSLVVPLFYIKNMEQGHPLFNRPSLGFYHTNCTAHFGEDSSTIRLTLGLDPAEVDILADCLKILNEL
jgi:hypothetical protein